jgi:cell division septum initiation protein DivIVA
MGPAEPSHAQTVEVTVENRTLSETNDQLRLEIQRLRSMLVVKGTADTLSHQETFMGEPLCLSTILSGEVTSLREALQKKNKALNVKYRKLREENKRLRGRHGELKTTLAQFSSSVHALTADVRAAVQDTPAMVQHTRPFLVV